MYHFIDSSRVDLAPGETAPEVSYCSRLQLFMQLLESGLSVLLLYLSYHNTRQRDTQPLL
jgi:hypothetical protein